MKKIGAIIRSDKFAEVDDALRKLGVAALALDSPSGRTERTGPRRSERWDAEEDVCAPTLMLEVIVNDSDARKVAETIVCRAATGSAGGGKVFVTSLEQVVEIGPASTKRLIVPMTSAA